MLDSQIDLPVRRIRQIRSNWCWAACVDMVLEFFGQPEVRQCVVVGKKLTQPCCSDPFADKFDVACEEQEIRSVWKKLGVTSQAHLGENGHRGFLKEEELLAELKAGRPVQVGFKWEGGGGHVVIIRGWRRTSNGGFFLVNDPWNWTADEVPDLIKGQGRVRYDELRQAYGMGKWRWTWSRLEVDEGE